MKAEAGNLRPAVAGALFLPWGKGASSTDPEPRRGGI